MCRPTMAAPGERHAPGKGGNIDATDRIIARSRHLRELLEEFDADLIGFDPGVLAFHDGVSIKFDANEWAWLEPLLIELRELRKG